MDLRDQWTCTQFSEFSGIVLSAWPAWNVTSCLCGQRLQVFFQSFVSFGWQHVKANAINVCSIISNVQMECSFRHNLLFSAFLKQSFARSATTIFAAGAVQQNLQLHARWVHWEDCSVLYFACSGCHVLLLLNDVSDRFGFWSPRSTKLGEDSEAWSIEERAALAREPAIPTGSIWTGQSACTIACSKLTV